MKNTSDEALIAQHQPEAIRLRLRAKQRPSLIPNLILGAIDGCVTTFAIIAGSIGAGISYKTAVVLGFANLLADGFSMGVSTYEAAQAERAHIDSLRKTECEHIEKLPEGEKEELRQLYQAKGLKASTVEDIVATISTQKKLWVDTMLTEEYGVHPNTANPLLAGLATFAAFVFIGTIPLLPMLIPSTALFNSSIISAVLAGLIFFSIGFFKGKIYFQEPVLSGFKTLTTGGIAAIIAFGAGHGLTNLLN